MRTNELESGRRRHHHHHHYKCCLLFLRITAPKYMGAYWMPKIRARLFPWAWVRIMLSHQQSKYHQRETQNRCECVRSNSSLPILCLPHPQQQKALLGASLLAQFNTYTDFNIDFWVNSYFAQFLQTNIRVSSDEKRHCAEANLRLLVFSINHF